MGAPGEIVNLGASALGREDNPSMVYLEIALYLLVGALGLYVVGIRPAQYMRDIKEGKAPEAVYQFPARVVTATISLGIMCALVVWPFVVPSTAWKRYRRRRQR